MPKVVSLSTLSRVQFDKIKKSFSCSNTHLEKHIKQFAYSHQKEGLFQTYFYVDDDETYLGFISLSVATIEREKIDEEITLPSSMSYSIPAIKITRLCAFDSHCRKGIGTTLMTFAHILATIQQSKIGCKALIVDSKPEAVAFYKKLDFVEINQEENSDTTFMVYDLLKPSELKDIIPQMIEFCRVYKQDELINILETMNS